MFNRKHRKVRYVTCPYCGKSPVIIESRSFKDKNRIVMHYECPNNHLTTGDTIEPGHSRDNYDDCPICRARREKGASAIEGTGHQEQVYCTTMRDYAAEYAAIYGKGDVYPKCVR